MAKESERKFLVSNDGWRAAAEEAAAIRQFYLVAAEDRSLRVRLKEGRAILTLKLGSAARERDEFEYPIQPEDAREMERFSLGSVVEKVRHLVSHGGHIYEVDEFCGALAGLVLAELETAAEVAEPDLPPWLGREVTGHPAYYNASLALHGLPETDR
ncbi:CYTH domain-containing protein [Chelativorans sp. AA-79]|uniref:CYTH domain-containing protein n=1 Tax=Chelativorans sp. AA-79 TaxID=3028735 RepID=UPI0023F96F0D|nr:CYTH domain-containing protein [Chelativorans sp. AA-79]WEX09377.1 CYTH domain-containing protein [Chelativorans sp. AA-79]